MNKTVSINLGGLFFHIDEDAYQKLNRYFDAIRKSLSPDGRDEIMNDIEGRIAELLSEMLKNDKQVAGIKEIDEVIAVMGEPEDYRIDDEPAQDKGFSYTYPTPPVKKFYLDGDRAIIAGVCAGLGHYFRIDPLWVRIIFIVSLFPLFGTTLLVYVMLWILIPKAITTTEKLEMVGEPINISNIEKKVKEDIDNFTAKINSYDYDKFGNTVGKGAKRVGNAIGDVFSAIFRVFAKIIGAILVVVTAVWLGCMLAMLVFVCFSNTMPDLAWYPVMNVLNYTDTPLWIIALLGFFAIGIPVFFLFLLGLKILVNNLRPVGQVTRYTFLAVWVLSVAGLIYFGLMQATEVSTESRTSKRESLYISEADTLQVKFRHDDDYSEYGQFSFTQDSTGRGIIYSKRVHIYVERTDEDMPYVKIEKSAWGNSLKDSRKRAESVKYGYEVLGNQLILDDYLLLGNENKFRDQCVNVYLYLPEGTKFKPDGNMQYHDYTDNSFFDLHYDSDQYIYEMGKQNVKCLNCPADEELPEGAAEGVEGEEVIERFNSKGGNINYEDEHVNLKVNINNDSINIKTRSKRVR